MLNQNKTKEDFQIPFSTGLGASRKKKKRKLIKAGHWSINRLAWNRQHPVDRDNNETTIQGNICFLLKISTLVTTTRIVWQLSVSTGGLHSNNYPLLKNCNLIFNLLIGCITSEIKSVDFNTCIWCSSTNLWDSLKTVSLHSLKHCLDGVGFRLHNNPRKCL